MSKNAYIGLSAVCFAVIYAGGWWLFRPRIEADLRARTRAAVELKISSLQNVQFAGRDGRLELSTAPDSADVSVASAVASKVWGVRQAQVETRAPLRVAETLRIERNGEALRVSGHFLSAQASAQLHAALTQIFPQWKLDLSALESNANQPAQTLERVEPFVPLLMATAPFGALDFADDRLVLSGQVPTESARTQLEQRARALPAVGFTVETSFTVATRETEAPAKTLASDVRRDLESTQVRFGFNSVELTRDTSGLIESVAQILQAHPAWEIEVTGHTDSIGPEHFNQKLSERRARAVVALLQARGIAARHLKPLGRGESQPTADNGSSEGRSRNRRVEFELSGETP